MNNKKNNNKIKGSDMSYYPIWRKPLNWISFYFVNFISDKLGFKYPYFFTINMIIIGLFGGIVSFWYPLFGSSLVIFSYFFDLVDGKLARKINQCNKRAKFLDWFYHSIVPSILILFSFFHYLIRFSFENTNFFGLDRYTVFLLIIIIPTIISLIYMNKLYLNTLFLEIKKDLLNKKNNDGKGFEDLIEKNMKKQIGNNKIVNFLFHNFLKLFVDSVDITFGIFFSILLSYIFNSNIFMYIYILILFLISIILWIYSLYNKYFQLYKIEKNINN